MLSYYFIKHNKLVFHTLFNIVIHNFYHLTMAILQTVPLLPSLLAVSTL